MSQANMDVFRAGIFHFDISGHRFTVYKKLIARNSDPLTAMMENGMGESQAGRAPLKATDKHTFGRFVEWMHTGDYNPDVPCDPPSPPSSPSESVASADGSPVVEPAAIDLEPEESVDDDDSGLESNRKKKKSFFKKGINILDGPSFPPESGERNASRLRSATSDIITAPALHTNSMFIPDNDSWHLDYLPVFLSHARLYVFADTYAIEPLSRLSARRLDEALSQFTFTSTSCTSFAELISYVYDNTLDSEDADAADILRVVVTIFAANNIEILKGQAEVRELLKAGGSFVDALVAKMCERFA